jgi:hypothetical protein
MSDSFSASIIGIDKLRAKLMLVAPAVADEAFVQASKYLLHVLVNKEVPPYKHVSRATAYPNAPYKPGWFSLKQFRYVMWAIGKGLIKIPYQRGGRAKGIETGWVIKGTGVNTTITNITPGAQYIYDPNKQARQLKLVGWKTLPQIIEKYQKNIHDSFVRGTKAALKRLGL